jgi:hypothetical protein
MPSAKYVKIREVIADTTSQPLFAIQAKYKRGGVRFLWPHVLGTSPNSVSGNPDEVVLCYQFGGDSLAPLDPNHPSLKNFRCFKLSDLTAVATTPFNEPWTPFQLKLKQVKRQNCVDAPDDVFR